MKVLPSNIGKKSEVTDPSDPLQTLVLQFEMYSTSCAANPSIARFEERPQGFEGLSGREVLVRKGSKSGE